MVFERPINRHTQQHPNAIQHSNELNILIYLQIVNNTKKRENNNNQSETH